MIIFILLMTLGVVTGSASENVYESAVNITEHFLSHDVMWVVVYSVIHNSFRDPFIQQMYAKHLFG